MRTVSAQILLVAAAVSFGISYAEEDEHTDKLSKFIEPGVIILILVLNATVGVWMVRAAARRGARMRAPRGMCSGFRRLLPCTRGALTPRRASLRDRRRATPRARSMR